MNLLRLILLSIGFVLLLPIIALCMIFCPPEY